MEPLCFRIIFINHSLICSPRMINKDHARFICLKFFCGQMCRIPNDLGTAQMEPLRSRLRPAGSHKIVLIHLRLDMIKKYCGRFIHYSLWGASMIIEELIVY